MENDSYACWREDGTEEDGRVMKNQWSASDAAEAYAEHLCDRDPDYYRIYESGDGVCVKDHAGNVVTYNVVMTPTPHFSAVLRR